MPVIPESIRPALADVLQRVVDGDQDGLKRDGIYPYEDDLYEFVREYGATLVAQPSEIWTHEHSHALELGPGKWAVDMLLWTAEQSPCDLYIRMEVGTMPGGPPVWIRGIDNG